MRKTSGLSLLLLIFLSLCLVTFSLLSVSESSADRKLSEKAAQHTTDYYDALSGYVKDAASSDTPAKTYLEACASITDLLPDVSWKRTDPDTGMISFQTTITDRQRLQCELAVRWPSTADDTLYEVTRQQAVNTSDWTPDTCQKLYQPK